MADSDASLSGEYVGIGALVDETDDGILIEGVFPESPADEAGLGVGDLIIAVDGLTVEESSVDAVADRIRGEAGTPRACCAWTRPAPRARATSA